jgi:hypothetical protein
METGQLLERDDDVGEAKMTAAAVMPPLFY